MKTKAEVLSFLSRNRKKFQEEFHILRIGLFGSYARGDHKEDSDIDLVVEFEENTPDLYELKSELKAFIKANLGLEADICREKYIKPRFKDIILEEAIYAD